MDDYNEMLKRMREEQQRAETASPSAALYADTGWMSRYAELKAKSDKLLQDAEAQRMEERNAAAYRAAQKPAAAATTVNIPEWQTRYEKLKAQSDAYLAKQAEANAARQYWQTALKEAGGLRGQMQINQVIGKAPGAAAPQASDIHSERRITPKTAREIVQSVNGQASRQAAEWTSRQENTRQPEPAAAPPKETPEEKAQRVWIAAPELLAETEAMTGKRGVDVNAEQLIERYENLLRQRQSAGTLTDADKTYIADTSRRQQDEAELTARANAYNTGQRNREIKAEQTKEAMTGGMLRIPALAQEIRENAVTVNPEGFARMAEKEMLEAYSEQNNKAYDPRGVEDYRDYREAIRRAQDNRVRALADYLVSLRSSGESDQIPYAEDRLRKEKEAQAYYNELPDEMFYQLKAATEAEYYSRDARQDPNFGLLAAQGAAAYDPAADYHVYSLRETNDPNVTLANYVEFARNRYSADEREVDMAIKGMGLDAAGRIAQITQEEAEIFNYYWGKKDYKTANAYLQSLMLDLNARRQGARYEEMSKFAKEMPLIAAPLSWIQSPVTGALAWAGTGAHALGNLITGKEIPVDINDPVYMGEVRNQATIQGLTDGKDGIEKWGIEFLNSLGQNAVQMPLGPAALPAMALSAAGQSTYDALQRGADAGQAFTYGGVSGGIEWLTERLPLDMLRAAANPAVQGMKSGIGNRLRQAGRSVLDQAMTEAGEETIGAMAGAAADEFIMGNKSARNLAIQQYMDEGLSRRQAENKANLDTMWDVIDNGWQGFLSGAVMGAGAEGIGATRKYIDGKKISQRADGGDLLALALQMDPTTEAYRRAQNIVAEATKKAPSVMDMAELHYALQMELYTNPQYAMLDTETGHTFAQEAVMRAYQSDKTTDQGLYNYAKAVLDAKMRGKRIYLKPYELGGVKPKTAQDIARLTGIDVSEYKEIVKPNTIEHIVKRHGEHGIADHSMQNLNDLAKIKWVIENCDSVDLAKDKKGKIKYSAEYKNSDGSHAALLHYEKRIDGIYVVAEAVPDSKTKTMVITSARIEKGTKKGSVPRAHMQRTARSPTSETHLGLASDISISQTNENINSFTQKKGSIPSAQMRRGAPGNTSDNAVGLASDGNILQSGGEVNTQSGMRQHIAEQIGYNNGVQMAEQESRAIMEARGYRETEAQRQIRLGKEDNGQFMQQQGYTDPSRVPTRADELNIENQKPKTEVEAAYEKYPVQMGVSMGDPAAIRAAEKEIKRIESLRAGFMDKKGVTEIEKQQSENIVKGNITLDQLPDNWGACRKDVVRELAELGSQLEQAKQGGINAQKVASFKRNALTAEALLGNPENLKLHKNVSAHALNVRTAERVFRKVFGDAKGGELIDYYITPIHYNESHKIQFTNELFQRARDIDLSDTESRLTQLVGEGKLDIAKLRNGTLNASDLPKSMDPKEARCLMQRWRMASPEKVQTAVDFYRTTYDALFDIINDFRATHGLPEIGKIENYFPHFDESDPLTKTLKQCGIEGVSALPTSIAGETAWFKPNSRWVPYFQERKGISTTYDAELGFQSYLLAVSDMLYHTDDIMKLRALETVIRGQYSQSDKYNNIDSILWKKENLDPAIVDKIIQGDYFDMEAGKEYGTFAQWLRDYTNKIANKQVLADRGTEAKLGRLALNLGNKIENQFMKNSVVGNLSSALNNSITLPKILATVDNVCAARALKDMSTGQFHRLGLAQESEFLQGKKGIDFLVKTRTQKAADWIQGHTFDPVEQFVSEFAFYSKYLENTKKGMNRQEAIMGANDYAAYMMARRTKGGKSLKLETKNPIERIFTAFQTEVANDWYSLKDDLPAYIKQVARNDGKAAAVKIIAKGLAQYSIYSCILNCAIEAITGFAPAPDPIRWIWEAAAALCGDEDDEDENAFMKVLSVGGELAGNVLSNIPGASSTMALLGLGNGRLPLPAFDIKRIGNGLGALAEDEAEMPNKWNYAGENLAKGLLWPAASMTLPFGGTQLKKTVEGLSTVASGRAAIQSKDGERLMTGVDQNAWNYLKGGLFGQSALPEVRSYYDSNGHPLSVQQTQRAYQAQEEANIDYNEYIQYLRSRESNSIKNTAEAIKGVKGLTDKQRALLFALEKPTVKPYKNPFLSGYNADYAELTELRYNQGVAMRDRYNIDMDIYVDVAEYYDQLPAGRKKEKLIVFIDGQQQLDQEQKRALLKGYYTDTSDYDKAVELRDQYGISVKTYFDISAYHSITTGTAKERRRQLILQINNLPLTKEQKEALLACFYKN